MQTTIYLMRHGGVENPKDLMYERLPGFPLSAKGRMQVSETAKIFEARNIAPCQIVSSPLERALQTATIVAEHLNAPLRTDERLTEWGAGAWKGKPLNEFVNKSGYYSKPIVMEGLEPHEVAASRVMSVIDELRRECEGKTALIVSHRESLVSAILKLQKNDYSQIHELPMPLASVWELKFDGERFVKAGVWSV